MNSEAEWKEEEWIDGLEDNSIYYPVWTTEGKCTDIKMEWISGTIGTKPNIFLWKVWKAMRRKVRQDKI